MDGEVYLIERAESAEPEGDAGLICRTDLFVGPTNYPTLSVIN